MLKRGHVWLQVLKRPASCPPGSLVWNVKVLWSLDRSTFINSLRSSSRESSAGPGGCTYEHLKLLLDERDATEFLVAACNLLAESKVPAGIRAALMGAQLSGALRLVALRHFVARPHICQEIHEGVRSRMRPFSIRPLHQSRDRLCGPHAQNSFRRQPKHDDPHCGRCWSVRPRVGEAPLNASGTTSVDRCSRRGTFSDSAGGTSHSIGIQGALEEVAAALFLGEQMCTFLDDVYLLCDPGGSIVALSRVAGIQLHQGKTRPWTRAGIPPEAIEELGEDVNHGVGTPIGSEQYISEKMEERITNERALWEAIPTVPRWQVLLYIANPRANHTMHTMPPGYFFASYRKTHDEGI